MTSYLHKHTYTRAQLLPADKLSPTPDYYHLSPLYMPLIELPVRASGNRPLIDATAIPRHAPTGRPPPPGERDAERRKIHTLVHSSSIVKTLSLYADDAKSIIALPESRPHTVT